MNERGEKFTALVEIITKLRQPDGCPWDQKQTVESFRPYLIEELHELLEAIDRDDPQLVKEELGDLFFQLIFLNNLYEERHAFSLQEVLEGISAKMIRRHPHVFGDIRIDSEKQLRRHWNQIKKSEKAAKGEPSSIFAFPRSLPALMRAQRVSLRAVASGFEWPAIGDILAKLEEELAELEEALEKCDQGGIEDEIGDLLFTMVNVSRKAGLDAEATLQKATDKFIRRFSRMSELAEAEGAPLETLDLAGMQRLWQTAKMEE